MNLAILRGPQGKYQIVKEVNGTLRNRISLVTFDSFAIEKIWAAQKNSGGSEVSDKIETAAIEVSLVVGATYSIASTSWVHISRSYGPISRNWPPGTSCILNRGQLQIVKFSEDRIYATTIGTGFGTGTECPRNVEILVIRKDAPDIIGPRVQ
jgi:hypothetical protein